MLSNAYCVREGVPCPGTVHAHPFHLVSLGRHPYVQGSFERLNAVLYSELEGLNRNYQDLVAIVPYAPSGSAELVRSCLGDLRSHRVALLMNHGAIVRHDNMARAYAILAYAENAARAALFGLATGAVGLPDEILRPFMDSRGLRDAYQARNEWRGIVKHDEQR